MKASYEAYDSYDKFTKDVLSHKIPTLIEEMKVFFLFFFLYLFLENFLDF